MKLTYEQLCEALDKVIDSTQYPDPIDWDQHWQVIIDSGWTYEEYQAELYRRVGYDPNALLEEIAVPNYEGMIIHDEGPEPEE